MLLSIYSCTDLTYFFQSQIYIEYYRRRLVLYCSVGEQRLSSITSKLLYISMETNQTISKKVELEEFGSYFFVYCSAAKRTQISPKGGCVPVSPLDPPLHVSRRRRHT